MTTYTNAMKPATAQADARVRVVGLGTSGCASAWLGHTSAVLVNQGSPWATTGFQANPRSVRRSSDS